MTLVILPTTPLAFLSLVYSLPTSWSTGLLTCSGDFGGIDFSKLGGAGGGDDFGEEEDDEDMPALEGEEEEADEEIKVDAKAAEGAAKTTEA